MSKTKYRYRLASLCDCIVRHELRYSTYVCATCLLPNPIGAAFTCYVCYLELCKSCRPNTYPVGNLCKDCEYEQSC